MQPAIEPRRVKIVACGDGTVRSEPNLCDVPLTVGEKVTFHCDDGDVEVVWDQPHVFAADRFVSGMAAATVIGTGWFNGRCRILQESGEPVAWAKDGVPGVPGLAEGGPGAGPKAAA